MCLSKRSLFGQCRFSVCMVVSVFFSGRAELCSKLMHDISRNKSLLLRAWQLNARVLLIVQLQKFFRTCNAAIARAAMTQNMTIKLDFSGQLTLKNEQTKYTVFENHRKSLNQHCERSELRLHFDWTKVYWKCQEWSILASFWKLEACDQPVLPDRSVLIGKKLVNATFWVMFKQCEYYKICL